MQIGIFGGTFNPIHNGHLAIARKIVESGKVDEVWFMVSPLNPFKQHIELLDDNIRLEMTRKALEGEHGIICTDYEFGLPRPSYTWNTLQSLKKDYPQHTFSLIIGADNWCKFSAWRNNDDIIREHRLLVYPRTGYPIDKESLPQSVSFIDMDTIDVSSTEIRQLIRNGNDVSSLIPGSILEMMTHYMSE